MLGEYKVPGGKLVVADIEVTDGQLERVNISGDFFLEPDSALETINAALEGIPADAHVAQLTQAIDSALDVSVVMFGFSSQSVGIAVCRALGQATGWHDHSFDVIPPVVMTPVTHVALDEILAEEVAAKQRAPILRFWDWNDSVVVIGAFQSLANEIDPDGASACGTDIVRRISGGGAMFMEPGNCITYSLIVPASLVEGLSLAQSYAFLDDWVLGALAEVGLQAHYQPLNDIASDQGKIGGAAQKRLGNGVVVHHATLAYDIDAERMARVLRIGKEKLSDKGTRSAAKRVDPMRAQTGMDRDAIMQAFLGYFRERYATRASDYTQAELDAAADRVASKFLTPAWTNRVP